MYTKKDPRINENKAHVYLLIVFVIYLAIAPRGIMFTLDLEGSDLCLHYTSRDLICV